MLNSLFGNLFNGGSQTSQPNAQAQDPNSQIRQMLIMQTLMGNQPKPMMNAPAPSSPAMPMGGGMRGGMGGVPATSQLMQQYGSNPASNLVQGASMGSPFGGLNPAILARLRMMQGGGMGGGGSGY